MILNNMFFIYETTNLINGKKYRGMHKTSNIDDGYFGSGKVFNIALKKYGKENFTRQILEYCNSYDELIEKEKIYVDENWVKDKSNYNLKTGGQSSGILSDESKNKISETLKRKYKNGEIIPIGPNKGISPSDEVKKKISDTLKEKYKNENHPSKGKHCNSGFKNGEIPWNKGLKTGEQSDKVKKKKSDTLKERYKNQTHHSKGKTPWNKGKTGIKAWNKGMKMEKIECPHCGKFSDKSNGKRWHFDNCKLKDQ